MGNGALKYWLYLKQEGVKVFVSKALCTFSSPLLKYNRIFIYLKSKDNPPDLRPDNTAIFKEASDKDISMLEKVMYQDKNRIHEKFLKGDRCFVAEVNGEIAHYAWVSFKKEYLPSIEKTIRLKNNEAYIYNVRTLPRFRNQGIFSFVLNNLCGELGKDAYARIWVSVLSDNVLSQKGFEKAGFKKFREIRYLRICGFRKYKFYDYTA